MNDKDVRSVLEKHSVFSLEDIGKGPQTTNTKTEDSFNDVQVSLVKTNLLPSESLERNLHETKVKEIIIKADVEKVRAVDEKIVGLTLKSDQTIEPRNGFLVEVFLSGSDGKLTRLFKDSVEDLYGNITEIGFSEYLTLETDKEIENILLRPVNKNRIIKNK